MKRIPKAIEPRSRNSSSQLIPKVIYQTFKSDTVTDALYKNFLSYIDQNPEYRYEFFDDQRMIDYVHNYDCSDFKFTNSDLQQAFNSIAVPAGRADIWRYLIIYERGGVYVDFDSYCLRPLHHSIDPLDNIVTCRLGRSSNYDRKSQTWLHLFPQWMLMYSPRASPLKEIIQLVVKHINLRLPIPNSSTCANMLERYTGVCASNYVYRKIFNIIHGDQENSLKPGIYNIECQGQQYRLNLKKFNEGSIFDNTILEKNFKSINDYTAELTKNNVHHWLTADKVFID